MKKVIALTAVLLFAASGTASADHHMKGEGGMKMMDTNKDGMISKDEFMKHHEMMYEKMKKNSAGMIDMKDMEAMHRDMASMHKDMKHGMKHDMKHDMKHETKK